MAVLAKINLRFGVVVVSLERLRSRLRGNTLSQWGRGGGIRESKSTDL